MDDSFGWDVTVNRYESSVEFNGREPVLKLVETLLRQASGRADYMRERSRGSLRMLARKSGGAAAHVGLHIAGNHPIHERNGREQAELA
jgi:hypothetical protein